MRYFVCIAEERNFTRAAEKLHMAQPPLSRQIKQLEEDLGVTLLDRKARPLRLTEAGRQFFEQSTQILARVETLDTMMRRYHSPKRSRFVIGFVPSTIYAALPDLVRRFRTVAPDVEVNLLEIVSAKQGAALKSGRIDVGFGRIRFEDAGIRRDVLREERLAVAIPLHHRLSLNNSAITLAEIAGEPLIIYPKRPRPSYADQVLSLYYDRGLEPRIVHEAQELQTAIGLVAAQVGITIVPASVKRMRTHDVVYREFDDSSLTSPIIMSRRLHDLSPWLALMGNVIVEAYTEWGWPAPASLRR